MLRDAGRVAEVARTLKCVFEHVHYNNSRDFRAKFVARFCEDRFAPLWDKFSTCFSTKVPAEKSWTSFAEFLKNRQVVLVSDFDDSRADLFTFQPMSASYWQAFLEELDPCDIYFTDPSLSYCLVFNHHDNVIAAGDAIYWAEKTFSAH